MSNLDIEAVETSIEYLESLEPMIALISGYKAKLMNAGFSELVAEEMCADLHHKIVETAEWDSSSYSF